MYANPVEGLSYIDLGEYRDILELVENFVNQGQGIKVDLYMDVELPIIHTESPSSSRFLGI